MPARIADRASNLPSIANTSPGDDLRRLDWRVYGRSDRFYPKEFEADTNLRCCLVLDTSGSMGFGSTRNHQDRIRPARSPGRSAISRVQQGDAVGLSCVAKGDRAQPAADAQSGPLADVFSTCWSRPSRRARRSSSGAARAGRTIRQRALDRVISDLFVEPEVLRAVLSASAVSQARRGRVSSARSAGVELQLSPADAVSRHGGRPGDLRRAERHRRPLPKALSGYLARVEQVVLESAVDYHRVTIDEDYEQVLVRFSSEPGTGEGAAMSFLQPWLLVALPLVALPIIIHLINQRRYQTIRWAAMMFLLAAKPHVPRLLAAAAMADHAVPHGWSLPAWCWRQPAAGQRLAGLGGGRQGRHDAGCLIDPLAQHAGAGGGRRAIEARNRPQATRPNPQHIHV